MNHFMTELYTLAAVHAQRVSDATPVSECYRKSIPATTYARQFRTFRMCGQRMSGHTTAALRLAQAENSVLITAAPRSTDMVARGMSGKKPRVVDTYRVAEMIRGHLITRVVVDGASELSQEWFDNLYRTFAPYGDVFFILLG